MSTIARPPLFKVARWQLTTLGLLSMFLLPLDWVVSLSVFIGGMIHIVPHAWFAKIAFNKVGASHADRIVASFYLGQAAKFILTAFLLFLAFLAANQIDVQIVVASFIAMFPLYLTLVTNVLRKHSA